MTTPKNDFPTPEQLNAQAGAALSTLSYNMGLLLGAISRLEAEKALLLRDNVEALELLRRGFELGDEIGLDVGWLMDVEVFLNEHSGFEREED